MTDLKMQRTNERNERNFFESKLEENGLARVDYIGRNLVTVGKKSIPIRGFEVISGNSIKGEAGTTGRSGNDSSCLTYIRVQDTGGTEIKNFQIREDEIEIILDGDSELESLITVLEGLALCLKKTMKDAERQDFDYYEWMVYEK